jgi:hypothetical protein
VSPPDGNGEQERARLKALKRIKILDTGPDETFDRITHIAARLFGVPIAVLGFLDQDRHWIKSRVGIDLTEIPRGHSLCDHTIRQNDVLFIPDALADDRFRDNPLVVEGPRIRFYAGAPLRSRDGQNVGSLAVADTVPRRDFPTVDRADLLRLAAATTDAVERRQTNAELQREQRALRKAQELTGRLLTSSAEGIFVVNSRLRCTLWNPAMATITGIAPERATDRPLHAAFPAIVGTRADAALQSAFGGRAAAVRDAPYVVEGEKRYFALHASPLRNRAGRVVGAIGFVRDTTERRRLESQLRQTQKMESIGQLTGGIAHDFNNLLTVVIGNLELLRPHLRGDWRGAKMLEDAAAAAERGERLNQQLIAFARRQRLEPKPLDLNAVVAHMAPLLQRTLGAAIEVSIDLQPDLWSAHADLNQLESALLNLALNARDAMPHGRLTLATRNRTRPAIESGDAAAVGGHDFVLLSVQDQGEGMPPEVADRVFEPFFTTKPKGKGSGLGLSQVYGFVMQSEGRIRIESAVGQGTRVMMFLPRSPVDLIKREAPVAAAAEQRGRSGNGERILIVDDEPDIARVAATALSRAGYTTLVAHDAREALAVLAQVEDVNAVLSDIVMPGEWSGLDLARHLRRTRPRLPVILTTGFSMSAPVAEEGFAVLSKPYRPAELIHMVSTMLPTRQAP